jgi:hypothetical protein
MHRFAIVVAILCSLALVVASVAVHGARVLAFPTDPLERPPLLLGCLTSRLAVDDQELPPSWRASRTITLDTIPTKGEVTGWYLVRKTDPGMPAPPAIWRFATADSLDVQILEWPVGFRVRLAIRDSTQAGRLVMTDDAGGKWIPRGTWQFALRACAAP